MSDTLARLQAALADHYAIEHELGAGGMATVYLAQDVKHERKVAVKVLRPELAAVLGAERFVQEIKTTANLQHPHILPLHDSGDADGFLYYVMPFIDGETLRDKLNRETQLGIEEAVRITCDVADALDYAHRNNVIHRDIKPENILLHDGRPMVADFGIALAVSAAAGGRMTETGLSLGTPHYMSPEQATAEKDLTNRSDIYSLGAVLFEMLTGDPPHTGSSAQQIIMKIVTEEVAPVTRLRKSVPRNVAAALANALEKLPADRFESAASFARALGDPSFDMASGATPDSTAPPLRVSRFWMAATAVSVLAAAALSVVHFREARPSWHTLRATIPLPNEGESEGLYFQHHLSPDGEYVAVSGVIEATGGIFIRALDSLEWRSLAGTRTGDFFWSPNSRSLAFFDNQQLKAVSVGGGPVQDIADVGPGFFIAATGTWSRDDVIVFSPLALGPLFRVLATGGEPVALTAVEPDVSHRYPAFLPDGQHFLYTSEGGSNPGIYVASLDDPAGRRLLPDPSSAIFAPAASAGGGHLIFVRDGRLLAQPFDPTALVLRGDPFVLAERALQGDNGVAAVSASDNGILTYLGGRNRETDSRLVWIDRTGTRLGSIGPTGPASPVSLSPDERMAAVVRRPAFRERGDVWLRELDRGLEAPFTFDSTMSNGGNVVWSPDGGRIAFDRTTSEGARLYVGDVASGTLEELIGNGPRKIVTDWSRGGYLLYTQIDPGTGADLLYLRVNDAVTGDVEPVAFREDQFDTSFGQISPDGKWIAYVSNETGSYEIWVQAFPSGAAKWRISDSGSGSGAGTTQQPRWSGDGSELFYVTRAGGRSTMMAARVRTQPDPSSSPVVDPRPLFEARVNSFAPFLGTLFYAVSGDGERFLINAIDSRSDAVINVVVNWEKIVPEDQ